MGTPFGFLLLERALGDSQKVALAIPDLAGAL
jgi:hypothetical protein